MNDLLTIANHARATQPLDILVSLTLLALVPFLLVTCTSFVRIIVVLSLVRSAVGASAVPPNAALSALALVLTAVVMTPTLQAIQHDAVAPYAHGRSRTLRANRAARAAAAARGSDDRAAAGICRLGTA